MKKNLNAYRYRLTFYKVWCEVVCCVAAPPPLDIGFLLTLSQEQMVAWDAFLVRIFSPVIEER